MALCPICHTPGAYVGFTTVECRNPDCEHFVLIEEPVCPCCGRVGHLPENCTALGGDSSAGIDVDVADPSALPSSTSGSSDSFSPA